MGLFSRRVSPIGLDLGSHSFKAVQLRWKDGWHVASSAVLPRLSPSSPLTRAEVERLCTVLDRRGFVGRDVVVSLPNDQVLTGILELPTRAAGVPIEQLAVGEFARVHKLNDTPFEASFWDLPTSARASKATFVLGVGARRELIDGYADLIESAGFAVTAVQEPSSALARGAIHDRPAAGLMLAIVDLGWQTATLTVLFEGKIVYLRKLSGGGLAKVVAGLIELTGDSGESAIEALAAPATPDAVPDRIAADAANAYLMSLLKEIGPAIDYASHQYPTATKTEVRLAGGGTLLSDASARFASHLAVDVAVIGAASGLNPQLVSALGLALWSEDGE